MKIVTGNDLSSGAVIWWSGDGWSRYITDAVDVGDRGDAVIAAEEAAQRLTSGYIIDAEQTPEGPRPLHIKERIRAVGPTVRLDLALEPADPRRGDWVI